jgi:hypothetical protein
MSGMLSGVFQLAMRNIPVSKRPVGPVLSSSATRQQSPGRVQPPGPFRGVAVLAGSGSDAAGPDRCGCPPRRTRQGTWPPLPESPQATRAPASAPGAPPAPCGLGADSRNHRRRRAALFHLVPEWIGDTFSRQHLAKLAQAATKLLRACATTATIDMCQTLRQRASHSP